MVLICECSAFFVVLMCICVVHKHNNVYYELRFNILFGAKQNESNLSFLCVFLVIHFCFPSCSNPVVPRKRNHCVYSKPNISNKRVPSLHCSHNKRANLWNRSVGRVFLCGQKTRKSNSNGHKRIQKTIN